MARRTENMCLNGKWTRRSLLGACAAGVGLYPAMAHAAGMRESGPLAPRPGQHPARARSLILVFLTGGMSHVDTFDPKPRLQQDAGRKVESGFVAASPFGFRRYGQSGIQVSDLFPSLGALADDLCVIRSLHTDITEHFQATLAMHTGSATVPLPSIGAWISYGLGTPNASLPSFMVLASHPPYAGAQVWDCGFLPAYHQGVRVVPGTEPIANLDPLPATASARELEREMLRDVNEHHLRAHPGDSRLPARIATFRVAEGMMTAAPAAFRVEEESESCRAMYGVMPGDRTSFAWQALAARRLVERGVRVVELIDTGSSDNWDAHGDMQTSVPKARAVDRPLAALIRDLKQRGLLEETLVAICTEFGRTPTTAASGARGREHHGQAFSCLLAGAGIRGGTVYGATDEYGIRIAADPVHVHDYHATILHTLGLDHTRLTYRYAGRDFRLTDVDGEVVSAVLR